MTVYITRCPVCQQAFKTNEHVLALKGGEVRCGFCQSVFNAYEHLYTPLNSAELGQLIEQQAQRQAQMQRKGLEAMAALAGELKGFGSGTDNDDSLIGVRAEPRLAPGPVKQEVINAGPSVQVIEHGAKIPGYEKGYANEELEGNDEEDYDYEEESPHKKRTLIWVVVALVALVGIACQLLAMNSNTVIEKLPQAAPLMDRVCSIFSCEAPVANTSMTKNNESLVQGPVQITDQELVPLPNGQYAIRVVLKNQSTVEQSYPNLTIVLKGEKEDILTRRHVLPSEYLEDASRKLPAQAQDEVSIAFNIADGKPATLAVEIDPVL